MVKRVFASSQSAPISSSPPTTTAPQTTTITGTSMSPRPTVTTMESTTRTGSSMSPRPTTSSTSLDYCSNGDGLYPVVSSGCASYYSCVYTGTSYQQIYFFDCPPGLIFDSSQKICNYPSEVACA